MTGMVSAARRRVRGRAGLGLAFVMSVGATVGATVATASPHLAAAEPPPEYQAISPQRLLDTRIAFGTASDSMTSPGVPTPIALPDTVAGAAAVAVNITVTAPTGDGFATAYPCGQTAPLASNVNYRAGQTVPNLVIAKPGDGGAVCVVTTVAAHLVADLQGWFPAGSYVALPAPQRVLDTRAGGGTKMAAGVPMVLVSDGSADAIVANVTAVDADAPGYLTVYPCGSTPPVTSNVNFGVGDAVANLSIAQSANGGVCGFASAPTDVVVDVQGRIPAGSGYTAITPVRMADTREPIGVAAIGRLAPTQVTALSFPVMSGIPVVTDTAVVNVTATDSLGSGFVTVYPCGETPPLASNLNIAAGETRSNLVLSKLGADGTICVVSSVGVHVVVDLQGWYAGLQPPPAVSPPLRLHVDKTAGLALGYIAYFPAGYTSDLGRTWPTMVFLHGSGQVGTGVGASLDAVVQNGLPLLYENGTEPEAAAGFVVLVPQLPDGSNSASRLQQWLGEVLPQYSVDRDRTYLTGLSAGGFGAFDYIGAVGDTNEFAAVVPIAGGFPHPIICSNWRHTPLWAFHGEEDPKVNPLGTINTVNAINANCAPTERLKLTTYPGVGHDSYDMTYDLSGMAPGLTNPTRDPYDVDIYTWMLSHVRSRTR